MSLKEEVKKELAAKGYDALTPERQELARDFGLVKTRKMTLPEIYATKWASVASFEAGSLVRPSEPQMKEQMSGTSFSAGQIDASFTPCDRAYSIIAKWAFAEGMKAATTSTVPSAQAQAKAKGK